MKNNNILVCPYCESTKLFKKGFKRSKQVYKCKDCHRKTVAPKYIFNESNEFSNNEAQQLSDKNLHVCDNYTNLGIEIPSPTSYNPRLIIEKDRQIQSLKTNLEISNLKYKELEKELNYSLKRLDLLELLKSNNVSNKPGKIEYNHKHKNEATAFICLSDLHLEEDVDPITVNHLNEFNLQIAEKRFKKVIENGLKLVRQQASDISIKNIVLWLGGDIISNYIHLELIETNNLSPNKAILFADKLLRWAIDFLLNNFDGQITIPTNHGNHGRSTEKMQISSSADNSWEYLLYRMLENRYIGESRVRFQIAESYHNYLDVYGFIVRMHHGDSVRYFGGVGGIYIPINKAIAAWNQGIRADLDLFGHFHQLTFAGNFVCNGSLIGYNPFALSIKASPEPPQQAFFLIDKERKRKTITAPIFVD